MASESPPPGSGDVKPATQAAELPRATTEGQVSADSKSVFVNSEPIREDQVQNAIKFLSHPRVQGSPIIHRRNFLERKGLTKEEIDEAFRRVPDPSPGVTTTTSAQTTTSQADGQVMTSSNVQQQGFPQTVQPAGGVPSGVVSTFHRQFHWYHAVLGVGFLAVSGAGTLIVCKNILVPKLKSWIRKVVSNDDNDDLKDALKPSLYEEAAAAAKAAAIAASDAAKASQEMVIMKNEENKRFEQVMSLLGDQLQEIKSMKTAMWKLEGQNYDSGKANPVEEYLSGPTAPLWKPLANGSADNDSRSARSSSHPVSSEPRHPKSYMDIMGMVQRGERPPNVRDINDAPPNPNQPISNPSLAPRNKPWETVEPARTNSFGSQSPYAGEVSSSVVQDNPTNYPFNNESSAPWWQQQKNLRITEIENEDNNQDSRYNGEIQVNQPPQRKWVPPMPPPVVMPEAAIAIRQPKSKAPLEKPLDSTSSNGSEVDELQKITRVSELGGETEQNDGGPEIASSSEIQEEQVVN